MKRFKEALAKCKQKCSSKTFLFFFLVIFVSTFSGVYMAFMTAGEDLTINSTIEINSSTTNGPTLSDAVSYGRSVANIGDLDGDGVDDLVVGAHEDNTEGDERGAVFIHFMNANQSIKSTVKIDDSTANGPVLSDYWNYGASVTALGDLDGDNVEDIAVGADVNDLRTFRFFTPGTVHISFLNTDGSVKSTAEINSSTTNGPTLSGRSYYGSSLANIGDLNDDGVIDLVVGAWADEDRSGFITGGAFIHFMNADGSLDSTVPVDSTSTNGASYTSNDKYGFGVAALGDLDDDGVEDIAVSAVEDDGTGSDRGAVYIHYLNTDASIKSTVKIDDSTTNMVTLTDNGRFGEFLAGAGDLDGDGVEDLLVGAPNNDAGGEGVAYILFLDTDGSIKSTFTLDSSVDNGPSLSSGDNYGGGLAVVGDLDSDGYSDIAVGADADDLGGTDRGALHLSYLDFGSSTTTSDPAVHPKVTMFQLADSEACYVAGEPIDFIFDGKNIDQFVAADNELFQEAVWEPVFTVPMTSSWTFDEAGVKTIYALFKNNNGNRTFVHSIDLVVSEDCTGDAPALPEDVSTGDVIRATDDNAAVYFVDTKGKKRPFLNAAIFFSWFDSFEVIKLVEPIVVNVIPEGDPVLYKPGSLVKYPDSPEVYFVDETYTFRHLQTEKVAESMFGDRWAALVIDVPRNLPLYFQVGKSVAGYNAKLLQSVQNIILE